MNEKKIFTNHEMENQKVFANEYWVVLLPRKPLSPFHLMIVSKQTDKKLFTDLDTDQLVSLSDCIKHLTSSTEKKYHEVFDGFNLFSNNGSVRIGQHMDHFHEHIFLRLTSETESPYTTMAQRKTWSTIDTDEWRDQKIKLTELFSD